MLFCYTDSKFANENYIFFFYSITCSLIPKGFMISGSILNDTMILEHLSKMMVNENGSEEALSVKIIATAKSQIFV